MLDNCFNQFEEKLVEGNAHFPTHSDGTECRFCYLFPSAFYESSAPARTSPAFNKACEGNINLPVSRNTISLLQIFLHGIHFLWCIHCPSRTPRPRLRLRISCWARLSGSAHPMTTTTSLTSTQHCHYHLQHLTPINNLDYHATQHGWTPRRSRIFDSKKL